MWEEVLSEVEERMKKSVEVLRSDLSGIRTGRASPALLENLRVDYYGTPTPLKEIASIAAPEPQLLTIRPWDPSIVKDVEKAILKSDLGLTPGNDGKIIRLQIPPLTEERRVELSRMVSKRVEEGRVAVRNCRRDALNDLRDLEKEKLISEDELYTAKEKLQELTDEYIEEVNKTGESKEKEVMEL